MAEPMLEKELVLLAGTIPAGIPDQYCEFVDRTGNHSIIGRWGGRVLLADRVTRRISDEETYSSVERAAAEYANWWCDENAIRPRARDVVKIYDLGEAEYVVLSVSHRGKDRWYLRVAHKDGRPGREGAVVMPGTFEYVTRVA